MSRTLVAAGVLRAGTGVAQTAPAIGTVEHVVVWGYGTSPQGRTRDLFARMTVVEDETIETPRDGAVHLKFLDGSSFRVGSQSRVMLDRFVYDPGRGTGEMSLELGTGAFRFISGRMDKRAYSLRTPAVTMGIRGTDFVVDVRADGTTEVSVIIGSVVLGASAVVEAGQIGTARGGGAIAVRQRPAMSRAIIDPGLDDAARAGSDGGGAGGVSGSGGGSRSQ